MLGAESFNPSFSPPEFAVWEKLRKQKEFIDSMIVVKKYPG
jgi:hypothetical protein